MTSTLSELAEVVHVYLVAQTLRARSVPLPAFDGLKVAAELAAAQIAERMAATEAPAKNRDGVIQDESGQPVAIWRSAK